MNSNEYKKNQRLAAINYIKSFGNGISPRIGKQEKQILDILEKKYQFKIQRQFHVIGFFLDGYIPELNLAIEVDEFHHFNIDGNLYSYDIKRQKEIQEELGCKFLRIKSNILEP